MEIPTTYDPSNEPYLGRELLYHVDNLIISVLKLNTYLANQSHKIQLSELQKMAVIVVPQSISLTLSIRELIRQGYLFGGHVLLRSLIERAAILLYLHYKPEDIHIWQTGWSFPHAPSLARMFETFQSESNRSSSVRGFELTKELNDLVHGKPDSGKWNIVKLPDGKSGYAVSKILDRPDLCDELCSQIISWLVVVQSMMAHYFPNTHHSDAP